MQDINPADLKPSPTLYQSSRAKWSVLVGEDSASPLIEAIFTSDTTRLRDLLSQAIWASVAFETPHCIYSEYRPSENDNDVREVTAMPMSNLERAFICAANNGNAEAVSALLDFAIEQNISPSSIITRWAVQSIIINGYTTALEAMAAKDPAAVNFYLSHAGPFPLDLAIKSRQTETVAVLLRLGADPSSTVSTDFGSANRPSLLSRPARTNNVRMLELLLAHGTPVYKSGALHEAAEWGRIDTARLLIQHGADVDELIPEENLRRADRSLRAGWTPSHIAAFNGKVDILKFLESSGARIQMEDTNGKTPAQLLEEYEQSHTPDKPLASNRV